MSARLPDPAAVARGSIAPRLYHLDWLRVLAMGAIFLFHNMRAYDFEDWHVKNAVTTQFATYFTGFCSLWMMPLFFVLSSAAIYYSLRVRTPGQFAKERFFRITVPWLTLGMFVFGPLQMYLERLSHGDFNGSFVQFIPHYFDGLYGFGGNFAWMGVHLWYLMVLSVFIALMLPFLAPRGKDRRSLLSRLSPYCRRAPVLVLLFVPIVLASFLSDALGLGSTRQMGGWDILSYLVFFTYGYVLHCDPEVQPAIDRLRRPMLVIAFVMMAAIVLVLSPWSWPWIAARVLCGWASVLAILGYGHTLLNFTNRFVRYANEAVLPFYILHQPVILVIAFFVVQLSAPAPAKYLLTATTSFVIVVALYRYVVSPLGPLRFLFGMRPKARLERGAVRS